MRFSHVLPACADVIKKVLPVLHKTRSHMLTLLRTQRQRPGTMQSPNRTRDCRVPRAANAYRNHPHGSRSRACSYLGFSTPASAAAYRWITSFCLGIPRLRCPRPRPARVCIRMMDAAQPLATPSALPFIGNTRTLSPRDAPIASDLFFSGASACARIASILNDTKILEWPMHQDDADKSRRAHCNQRNV